MIYMMYVILEILMRSCDLFYFLIE